MEASGDSLYPFDLWSRKRGRAFLGHANSPRHKCLPHLHPLYVELISLEVRGRVESVSKSAGQSMNEKVRIVQVSGNDGAARQCIKGNYPLSVMAEIRVVGFDRKFLKQTLKFTSQTEHLPHLL